MKMRAAALAFVLGVLTAGAVMAATEHKVMQKGKQFSESEIAVKKGDTVLFVNDDSVVHNILSTTAGNDFNLGAQQPGAETPVTFDKDGIVTVICAIHPRMKMTITIAD